MDTPPIQYCKTSDGVSIAYYAVGEGPAVVSMMALPFRHIQRQWEISPQDQQIAELLVAQNRRFVQFDPRGMGSSSRVEAFDLDGFVADLEAVVDSLGLEQFDLVAITYSTPVAIAYAARHLDQLSNLVLISPFARGTEALDNPIGKTVRAIRGQDWEVYTKSVMHVVVGWERAEFAQQQSAILREAVRPEDGPKIFEAVDRFDVTALLDGVRVPTLVLANQVSGGLIPSEHARVVAAGIPGAQFVTTSPGQELAVIARFLGLFGNAEETPGAERAATASTAIILFADVADSTELSEQLGDAVFRERSRTLEELVRTRITEHGGTSVEGRTLGDGVLGTFASASDAIAAAVECATAGENVGLALHLGLHAGDVIREDANVYGHAVSIASRVSGLSAPNEVLVSATVRDLARASAGVTFEDRGERELKGVSEPVRVYEVRWRDDD
jgi:class 3 adenylate cyclase/pimeloyl-ACP methyl ester carboxylesterase